MTSSDIQVREHAQNGPSVFITLLPSANEMKDKTLIEQFSRRLQIFPAQKDLAKIAQIKFSIFS